MLDVSIVIVSWNVADLLRACLNSIYRQVHHVSYEVIVVDSASSDASVAMLASDFPQVISLPQRENVGFTCGNNLGFAAAQGRMIFMLNPDTELHAGALDALVAYLDAHPQVGIVGPHTLNSDGTHQSTRRRFPTRQTAFFESTWLQPYAPVSLLRAYYAQDIADDASATVDWVQGSALLFRRELYGQLGGLDEGYVMYCEELDFCKRARDAGWQVVYLGDAFITHHGGKSSEQAGAHKHIHFQKSKIRYFRRYYGAGFAALLRLFLLSSYAWQLALEAAKSALGNQRPMRQQRIRAYWQVLRDGLAPAP